jgi:putative membrane protein
MMMHDWGAVGFFGWMMMILFWVALILAVAWAVRNGRGSQGGWPDAVEVLRQRLARGEIDRDEYEERLRTLSESSKSTS